MIGRGIRSLARSLVTGVAVACVLAVAPAAVQAQSVPVLTALLHSAQEVPPTGSTAFGSAFMTVDLATSMLCYSISYSDLESAETAAHFHGPAQPGSNAGVLFDISPEPSPLGSPKDGCVGPLTAEHRGWLIDGLVYINIHSMDDGGGEIRGQVIPQAVVPTP